MGAQRYKGSKGGWGRLGGPQLVDQGVLEIERPDVASEDIDRWDRAAAKIVVSYLKVAIPLEYLNAGVPVETLADAFGLTPRSMFNRQAAAREQQSTWRLKVYCDLIAAVQAGILNGRLARPENYKSWGPNTEFLYRTVCQILRREDYEELGYGLGHRLEREFYELAIRRRREERERFRRVTVEERDQDGRAAAKPKTKAKAPRTPKDGGAKNRSPEERARERQERMLTQNTEKRKAKDDCA